MIRASIRIAGPQKSDASEPVYDTGALAMSSRTRVARRPAAEPGVLPPAIAPMATASVNVLNYLERSRADRLSPRTRQEYASAVRYWTAWYELKYDQVGLPLPVPPAVVLEFLSDHVAKDGRATLPPDIEAVLIERKLRKPNTPTSYASMNRYIAALIHWHDAQNTPGSGWASPFRHPLVADQVALLKRDMTAASTPVKKEAVLASDLERMLAHCQADLAAPPLAIAWRQRERQLKAIRDQALLLFGWSSGGRRRSEIAEAEYERLTPRLDRDGNPIYLYDLGRTKTKTAGELTSRKVIAGTAFEALQRWLGEASITSGRIFRAVYGGTVSESLTGRTVARIIAQRARGAGLQGDYGGHSLRSGFITEALATDGIRDHEIMEWTEHRSSEQMIDRKSVV
jgi:integrase